MTDQLKKYLTEDRSVRIQAVRLEATWKAVQANHDYPPAITHLLGELVAASTLLAANIKFDGSLVLQIQGDGPIALLVVECRSDLSLRATVKVREGHDVPADGDMQSLLNPGGILMTYSCSGGIGLELFQKIVAGAAADVGVEARILHRLSAAPDHPIGLAVPEGEYLKGLACQV